jgi:hypothetical protein
MTRKSKETKRATARTTSLRILPLADTSALAQAYQLVRYVLPENLRFMKEKNKWERMHNGLKESISAAYKIYTHDKLDVKECWALYVLYPKMVDGSATEDCPVLRFEGEVLPARELRFNELDHHILVKLLQVAYFRNEENQRKNLFVGQDKCYLHAKRRGSSSNYHICLQMDVRGDTQDKTLFYVEGKAQTFAKVDNPNPDYISRTNYFAINEIREDLITINEVKSSNVPKTANLFVPRSFAGSRTGLDFHHAYDEIEQTRGYLVDTFIKSFLSYLQGYGFQVEHLAREFQRYEEGSVAEFSLPIDALETVHLYDARYKTESSLQPCVAALVAKFPDLEFVWISELDKHSEIPVLIFQDAEANAFKESKALHGSDDPHEQIYENYKELAKQFVNVNPNEAAAGVSREEYLDYEPISLGDEQMQMLMNELFLKDSILRQRDVRGRLPLIVEDLVFVRKENRGRGDSKRSFEVAMYFKDNRLQFLDIEKSLEDREIFYTLLENIGMDWDAYYEQMQAYHLKLDEDKDLNSYDLIIGPGLLIEIGEPKEALLYEYEKILQRVQEYSQPYAIDELKLAEHYDEIVREEQYSRNYLIMREYISPDGALTVAEPKNQKYRDAVALYHALYAYDTFLDSLKRQYASLSFAMLTKDAPLIQRIEELFNTTTKLRGCYNAIGMFKGTRDAEVIPVYQGIWYTQDWHYVVGDVNAMNSIQARANRVRQLIIHKKSNSFGIEQILEASSVKFVRLNQYTVYPYYFHLIGLYIDNVLQYP